MSSSAEWPPEVLIDPSSVNALVGSRVTFTCTIVNADIALWFVNDSTLDMLRNLEDTQTKKCSDKCWDGVYVYSVSFIIEEDVVDSLNNSNFSCVGFQESTSQFSNPSSPATLQIQGNDVFAYALVGGTVVTIMHHRFLTYLLGVTIFL